MVSGFKQYLEEKSSVGYFAFGRFNPPTTGHEKLITKVASLARGNDYKIFASQSVDAKKNPLEYRTKVKFMRKMFPKYARNIIMETSVKNFLDATMYMYKQGYKNLVMVAGDDRVQEFQKLLTKYNGVDSRHGKYEFDSIKVVSAGERDPDADDVTGMSASKQRENAKNNDFAKFSQGLPKGVSDQLAKQLFNAVRKGMNLNENTTFTRHIMLETVSERREDYVNGELFTVGQQVVLKETDEVVTIDHCGANYLIVEVDGKKKRKWLTDVEPLEEKVSQSQINDLERFADKLLAKYDIDIEFTRHFVDRVNDARNNPEIKIAELQKFFKKIHKAKGNKIKSVGDMQAVLKDVEKDLNIPAVLQDKGKDFEVRFKTIMRKKDFKTPNKVITYEQKVAQDPDVKDKKGTQPKKYYSGLAKSTKSARDAHFKKGAKMDDDNPAAYKPAPGDKEAETKPSKYTKKFKQMYGEAVSPAQQAAIAISKKERGEKPKNEGDGLWANIHKKRKEGRPMRKPGSKGAPTAQDFKNARGEETMNEEEKKGLAAKAEKSGVSLSILKQVYNRGMAAWRTGHRPGTTPQQWGMARVNSFLTGGKTRRTADKDLWAKVKK
tara:strand:+ start:2923 stop:4743 length:1821 start_codon:yes stop_codon:yes gene_type:complete